ncbi:RhuM family protein [Chitinophaga alhagiae]|uniref:RhuM family protein n=1 Tax=Chitinophaga alhagiae TaxID=2203219 RepID=UPI001E54E891|nr:RhuM family protein [Chitinophaga alhagiae]
MSKGSLIIYKTNDDKTSINVILGQNSVWLDVEQISELFDRDRTVVSKHINNIFKEKELQKEGHLQVLPTERPGRTTHLYSLDVIISIGYRVKSQRGTQFRMWANNVLREYLVQGYAINEARLKEQEEQLTSLKQTVRLMSNIIENNQLSDNETAGLLKVLSDYTYALDILDKYDHQQLSIQSTTAKAVYQINYPEAISVIQELRQKFGGGDLFGNEKDDSFKSSLAVIY